MPTPQTRSQITCAWFRPNASCKPNRLSMPVAPDSSTTGRIASTYEKRNTLAAITPVALS